MTLVVEKSLTTQRLPIISCGVLLTYLIDQASCAGTRQQDKIFS